MPILLPSKLFDAIPPGEKDKFPFYRSNHRGDDMQKVDLDRLSPEDLRLVMDAAQATKDRKSERAISAWLDAREGRFDRPLPSFGAFSDILLAYLAKDAVDGWVWVDGPDGLAYPHLVTNVRFDDGRGSHRVETTPRVVLDLTHVGLQDNGTHKRENTSFHFDPADVARRKVADVLEARGIRKETPELREAHDVAMARHAEVVRDGFGRQFRFTGRSHDARAHRSSDCEVGRDRKVIHDVERGAEPAPMHCETPVLDGDVGPVPVHPVVRVFDLGSHAFYKVNGAFLTPYEYDPGLRDKLVLPRSHHDLLEVLTTDLDAFAEDFVEGKRAGNIILLKGKPGTGKTLTAEAYAELVRKPLYTIRAGALGTTAAHVGERLDAIVRRAQRWDCVLLLDEADVFCATRGNDLDRDAITAEMLRTLEYLDALLFMTTNRPDDIDEAIVGRCIAIVGYENPRRDHAIAIWTIFGNLWKSPIDEATAGRIVDMLPEASARDVKMLFSLTLRMCKAHGHAPTLDDFRRYAVFRGLIPKDPEPVNAVEAKAKASSEWRGGTVV